MNSLSESRSSAIAFGVQFIHVAFGFAAIRVTTPSALSSSPYRPPVPPFSHPSSPLSPSVPAQPRRRVEGALVPASRAAWHVAVHRGLLGEKIQEGLGRCVRHLQQGVRGGGREGKPIAKYMGHYLNRGIWRKLQETDGSLAEPSLAIHIAPTVLLDLPASAKDEDKLSDGLLWR